MYTYHTCALLVSGVSFAVVAVLVGFNENGFVKHSCGLSKQVMLFIFFRLKCMHE